MERDAPFLERHAQTFGNVAVERGEHLLAVFNNRHFRTERLEHRGEFQADDPSADDSQAGGQGFYVEERGGVRREFRAGYRKRGRR